MRRTNQVEANLGDGETDTLLSSQARSNDQVLEVVAAEMDDRGQSNAKATDEAVQDPTGAAATKLIDGDKVWRESDRADARVEKETHCGRRPTRRD